MMEEEASVDGIEILTEWIPVADMTATYFRTPMGTPKIVIEPGDSSKRACDLAEELGHHNMGTPGLLRYDTPDSWRAEARARKWAHDKLLSADVIMVAARNATDIYELAEALGVTEQFLREAVDDYMARGLWAI